MSPRPLVGEGAVSRKQEKECYYTFMIKLSELQSSLITLAQEVADAILVIYVQSKKLKVRTKSDFSPLTEADLLANQMLVDGLKKLTPDLPIISEETQIADWAERQTWSTYWLLDPLDGTRPFIAHAGEFTVNIALIQDHRPIFGLVHVPIAKECYFAYAEVGARKIDAHQQMHTLHVRPWRPGHTDILTSHGARDEKIRHHFGHLGNYTARKLSSSWKFCLLAEGKADISPRLGNTSEWDTAAGQCVLEQAGGAILNLQGEPLRYNMKASLLNPHFIALGDVEGLKAKVFEQL